MSAPRTKIFGMDLGIDPKVIILILLILAGAVYYFTSSSEPSGGSSGPSSPAASLLPAARPALTAARARRMSKADRDVLKLVPIDGSRGDVDPTLHLRLLERVKNVPPAAGLRNLFDTASPVLAQNVPPVPAHPPILPPKPLPGQMAAVQAAAPSAPPFNIPLKYYGFAKPKGRAAEGSRGLFLDGDNILIGAEGDLLEKHFLIVALTPTMARLEDTLAKQGQDIPVTPEAPPAQ